MARFRGRECHGPRTSKTFLQLCLVLFVLGSSFTVLFLVMHSEEHLACDYTDVVEQCDEQPVYSDPLELQNTLDGFHYQWQLKAQEKRLESETQKCATETKLMTDLTALHHAEANRIIAQCQARFQACVDMQATPVITATGETTVVTTTTTTIDSFVKTTPKQEKSDCQTKADAAPPGTQAGVMLACQTQDGADALREEEAIKNAPPAPGPPMDCTRCNSFCRAYNWTQLYPDLAVEMNYTREMQQTGTCGPKVCPWIPECGGGMNLHRNCSAKGCPCKRASCVTPPPPAASPTRSGGRLLSDVRRAATWQANRPENMENFTCTCKPGLVDTVMVGRPFKVFFGDPETMHRRRTSAAGAGINAGGRRLHPRSFDGRFLSSIYDDPANVPIEWLQGVHIETEEEIGVFEERAFDCKMHFSDRYKYVYPRLMGPINSYEALMARQSHPDLGCGYSGKFKVTCDPTSMPADSDGTCSYNVDISTCAPPTYQEAVDSCFQEDTWSSGGSTMFLPEVSEFLETEDMNLTVAEVPHANFTVEKVGEENPGQCCEEHVASECVADRDHPGTKKGTGIWSAEKSYLNEAAYFPVVKCGDQAPLIQHSCPRVKIHPKPSFLHDMHPECDEKCNLTWAQEELMRVCDNSAFPETRDMEQAALRSKVSVMTKKRTELEKWALGIWPLVPHTTHVVDCVADMGSSRYNMIGWPGSRSAGFDKLKLRYECKMQKCTLNQCLKKVRKCEVPQMAKAPERTCGPFGDFDTFTCIDKVPFESTSMGYVAEVGMAWLGLSACCFICGFYACLQAFCGKKKSRVVPYHLHEEATTLTPCGTCGTLLDNDEIMLLDNVPICSLCVQANKPDVCRNCGEVFEDADDTFCVQCSAPRVTKPSKMIMDAGAKGCQVCGEPMGENDGKCPECGWHPDMTSDAIVLKADTLKSAATAPLRANAQSAANEHRIVLAAPDATGELPVVGQE